MKKLVIAVRDDLEMSPGKIAAQCVHAALALPSYAGGVPVVVVSTPDVKSLAELVLEAIEKYVEFSTVKDAGRTEVEPGTTTCAAFFGEEKQVDKVTGQLPLLKEK